MQYLPGRLIKGVTGKLRSDDTARLSRGVAVSSSHLSSSSSSGPLRILSVGTLTWKFDLLGHSSFHKQTNLGSKEQGNNMATNHHTGPWHFVEFKALAEKNYCDKIGLLKNTDLQRYLYQSHIGSMIGLWNISLSQCIIALMFLFPISSLPPCEFKGTNFAASVVWPQASPDVSWCVHIWCSR